MLTPYAPTSTPRQEFFDITYCYFPITFRPPPDDPYGITTQDLKSALRKCLTANPMLAPHAMPLLLEKLAASGGSTKRDTLDTLEHALPVFGQAAVLANQKKLWEGFKVEIMAATDEETSVYAQRALASFLRVLYGDAPANEDIPQDGIATRIVTDALTELEAPEKSLAKPATDLLVSMVKACPATSHLATYALLDQMLTMFKDPDVTTIRAPILGHIATLLKALREVYAVDGEGQAENKQAAAAAPTLFKFAAPASSTTASSSADVEMTTPRTYEADGRPLDAVRDELLSALSNGIRSPSYRSSALLAFVHLTHIPSFLTPAETNYMAESVNDLILSPTAEDVRGAALDGLRDIARVNPRVLEETTLPLLFARLPDGISSDDGAESTRGVVRRALGALARLCTQEALFDTLVVKLFAKLELICATPTGSAQEHEGNVGYVRGLLVTVLTVLEEKTRSKHADVARYGVTLPPRLFSLVLSGAARAADGNGNGDTPPPVATDERVIRDIGRLLTVLVRALGADKQAELAQWMYSVLLSGSENAPSSPSIQPLEATAPTAHRNTLYAFSAALIPLSKQVPLPCSSTEWLQRTLDFVLTCTTTLQADGGYRLLAASVNKHVGEPVPADALAVLDAFWKHEVAKDEAGVREGWTLDGVSRHNRAIRAWFWLCKALIVRNSAHGQAFFERARGALLANTASPYVAKEAAKCTGLVAHSEDGVLSKENGAVVRLLWKQKFFAYLVPRIIEAYQGGLGRQGAAAASSPPSSSSSIHLIALASVLPHMPRQTTTERLPDIFPLLIRALELPDGQARSSAATTLTLAAAVGKQERDAAIRSGGGGGGSSTSTSTSTSRPRNSLDLVEDHLATLVDRLLSISQPSRDSPPQTRIAALRCLGTIARTVPYTTLKNQQVKVTRALNGPGWGVDDPRKDVRVQAVDTKAVWHAVG